jgi:hypothetical protein
VDIAFGGITMATDDTRSGQNYEVRETAVSSSYDLFGGQLYTRLPIGGSSLVKDTIVLLKGSISVDGDSVDFAFQNLPVTYHGDTMICSLTGIEASSHVISLFDKTTTIHMGGMQNDYTEYSSRTYLECTANTYIDITLPKLQ